MSGSGASPSPVIQLKAVGQDNTIAFVQELRLEDLRHK